MQEKTINKKAILAPDGFYHIYNRAHGNEKLFLSDDNYRYFLRRFEEVLGSYVVLHCYCLMPNHFHFLIQIKGQPELIAQFEANMDEGNNGGLHPRVAFALHPRGLEDLEGVKHPFLSIEEIDKFLIQKFSNFFNGYTKAFNKQQRRLGGLFMSPFNRIAITTDRYRQELVPYIHLNPVEAGLCYDPKGWEYSSYSKIIETINQNSPNEVVSWFDDIENFKVCHRT